MTDIKEELLTTDDRSLILDFLDSFEKLIFDPSANASELIEGLSSINIREFLKEKLIGLDSNIQVTECKRIREELLSMLVVTVTAPVDLGSEQKTGIARRVRSITGKQVLTEFKKDPDLIGGALIEGDGRIGEYSFRRYFEKRIEERSRANGV